MSKFKKSFTKIEDPFANFQTPDTWANVQEFSDWWMNAKMPVIFPQNPEVFLSDDATAICLFRHGRFQVELYLIHPKPGVPTHEHPGVEVIKIRTGISYGNIHYGRIGNAFRFFGRPMPWKSRARIAE